MEQPKTQEQVIAEEAAKLARQEGIVRQLRVMDLNSRKTSLSEKNVAMKAATRACVSLASMSIYTRDRVEAEIIGRRQAELNRQRMPVSPDPLVG